MKKSLQTRANIRQSFEEIFEYEIQKMIVNAKRNKALKERLQNTFQFVSIYAKALMYLNQDLSKISLLTTLLNKQQNDPGSLKLSLMSLKYQYDELADYVISDVTVKKDLLMQS